MSVKYVYARQCCSNACWKVFKRIQMSATEWSLEACSREELSGRKVVVGDLFFKLK